MSDKLRVKAPLTKLDYATEIATLRAELAAKDAALEKGLTIFHHASHVRTLREDERLFVTAAQRALSGDTGKAYAAVVTEARWLINCPDDKEQIQAALKRLSDALRAIEGGGDA